MARIIPSEDTGFILVNGEWVRPKSTLARATAVAHTTTSAMTKEQLAERKKYFAALDMAKRCRATGMPAELVSACVEGLQAGVSMEEVIETLKKSGVPEVAADDIAASAIQRSGRGKILIYGGAAAAALVLFLLLRKKKQS